MALISDADVTWSAPITLGADEIWQVRAGRVFVTSTATPDAEDGIELFENQAIRLSAGQTVQYRKLGSVETRIVRETV